MQSPPPFAPVRMDLVRKMFDGRMFDTAEARNVWGDLVPQDIPRLPFFSDEELERANELGQCVCLYIPITMKQISDRLKGWLGDGHLFHALKRPRFATGFFLTETPALGYRLVSKKPIPGSVGQNYLVQTQAIADYVRDEVYKGMPMPPAYQEALEEFESNKPSLQEQMDQGYDQPLMENEIWYALTRSLVGLKLNRLFRSTASETFQRIVGHYESSKLVDHHRVSGEYLLSDMYAWTATSLADQAVFVGFSSMEGVVIDSDHPGYDSMIPSGVLFSRSPVPEGA